MSDSTLSEDSPALEPPNLASIHELPPTSSLMALLSGPQKSASRPRKHRTRDTKQPAVQQEHKDATDTESVSEPDSSFDVEQFRRTVDRQAELVELERKVYSERTAVSVQNYLGKKRQTILGHKKAPVAQNAPLAAPDHAPLSHRTPTSIPHLQLATPSMSEEVEPEIVVPVGRLVSARDLFSHFGPSPAKTPTRTVKLKISSGRLAEIERRAPPIVVEDEPMALAAKRSLKITLKVPISALEDAAAAMNPLYTRGSAGRAAGAALAFLMMMRLASAASAVRLSPMQKLKLLEPPALTREQMHVMHRRQQLQKNSWAPRLALRVRESLVECSSLGGLDTVMGEGSKDAQLIIPGPIVEPTRQLVIENAPLAFERPLHQRIYNEFVLGTAPDDHQMWMQRFQPHNLQSVLLPSQTSDFIGQWLCNAFEILKTQSTKTPRATLIKQQQRKQKKRDSFIVDDFDDDDDSTDEDVFVPLLIIEGDVGSGKTSVVYAAMEEINGYVHEINTGQNRLRRDVYLSLREFCTTQIILQKTDEKTFQKGVVLFEDCDILFEQDKTFWTVVQDVVNFLRRPIIITVNDASVIPKNICELAAEQNSHVSLNSVPRAALAQYLWLCAFSQNYVLDGILLANAIEALQTDRGYDLRRALTICQWYCVGKIEGKLVGQTLGGIETPPQSEHASLECAAEKLDLLSAADVIDAGTTSRYLYSPAKNELLDVGYLSEPLMEQKQPLSNELNIGQHIKNGVFEQVHELVTPALVREVTLQFHSSRARKSGRIMPVLRSRSRSTEPEFVAPATQGVLATSALLTTPNGSFLAEFAPFARHWARTQNYITSMDVSSQMDGRDTSLESFLRWRRFHLHVGDMLDTFVN